MDSHGSVQSTPRWVKVSGIVVAVVLLLFILHIFAMKYFDHTFGMHGGDAPTAGVQRHDRQHP